MSTDKSYLNFILEQLSGVENISCRAMMGEYLLYAGGKLFGGIYDNRFLVKNLPAARAYMPQAREEIPYPGAKPMLLVDNVDNRDYLSGLLDALLPALPATKKGGSL